MAMNSVTALMASHNTMNHVATLKAIAQLLSLTDDVTQHHESCRNAEGHRSWREMLEQNATMTIEHWFGVNMEKHTWAHPWSAGPAAMIVRRLFGVRCVIFIGVKVSSVLLSRGVVGRECVLLLQYECALDHMLSLVAHSTHRLLMLRRLSSP
jgi:hypothetical protein